MNPRALLRRAYTVMGAGILILTGLPHAGAAVVESLDTGAAESARRLEDQGEKCRGEGKLREADSLLSLSVPDWVKVLGPEHRHVATLLYQRARLNHDLELYEPAEDLYKQSIAMSTNVLPPGDPDIAIRMTWITLLYCDRGRKGEAATWCSDALEALDKSPMASDPRVGTAYNNVARAYQKLGKMATADSLFHRAISVADTTSPDGRLLAAERMYNLACLYWEEEKIDEAELLLDRTLKIRTREFGSDHPTIGETLSFLASVFDRQERYAEAESLLASALAIQMQTYGPNGVEIVPSLNNLARLYSKRERFQEAESLLYRALAIREGVYGSKHMQVAKSLQSLGRFYDRPGEYAKAQSYYRRALDISEELAGNNAPETVEIRGDLAGVFRKQFQPFSTGSLTSVDIPMDFKDPVLQGRIDEREADRVKEDLRRGKAGLPPVGSGLLHR
jgi:tetratricopeptide (TPR) repeat protein